VPDLTARYSWTGKTAALEAGARCVGSPTTTARMTIRRPARPDARRQRRARRCDAADGRRDLGRRHRALRVFGERLVRRTPVSAKRTSTPTASSRRSRRAASTSRCCINGRSVSARRCPTARHAATARRTCSRPRRASSRASTSATSTRSPTGHARLRIARAEKETQDGDSADALRFQASAKYAF